MDAPNIRFRDVKLAEFDTTAHLAHAAKQAAERHYEDFQIVDVDSHHYEIDHFAQIIDYIEDPVFREEVRFQGFNRAGIAESTGRYQEMTGRIIRYPQRTREKAPPTPHRDLTLTRRWMDALDIDMICMFPTPMLNLGQCPRIKTEVALARAYCRWLIDTILAEEPRIRSMLYLPFNDAAACLKMVEDFGDKKGVIGFMVTAPHYQAVDDNAFIPVYRALEERGLPLAFHAAYDWGEQSLRLMNRFIGVHALGFTWSNMLHLTNWIVNGLPERFPKLKVIWIESGLAWVPFMMQRLDNEYMMRSSDVPLLKRKPSDYMREMYFTSQPMEMVDNREALELTFKMIKAETQLLYSSDYPHWDMDLPSTIYDLPFLSQEARRDILGGNARRLFGLPDTVTPDKLARRAARTRAQAGG